MTEATQAAVPAAPTSFADESSELSAVDAFRAINKTTKELEEPEAPSNADDDSPAPTESADEVDAAAADDAQPPSGDDAKEHEAGDDLPPIAAPGSWTKEEKEAFAALPRANQQTIVERWRVRDADSNRRQNEAAKREQAAEARELAAEQARKQFEAQIPVLRDAIQSRMNADFADIKTVEDVQRMGAEDPVRFNQWQVHMMQLDAANRQVAEGEARQQREAAAEKGKFFEEESKLFAEKAPEWADPKKAPELRAKAFETLHDIGFTAEEINDAWNKGGSIPVHSHKFQLLVWKAMRFDAATKTVAKPQAPKAVPQVQRPGPASSSKDQRSEHVNNLEKRLERTGSRRDALALMRAR